MHERLNEEVLSCERRKAWVRNPIVWKEVPIDHKCGDNCRKLLAAWPSRQPPSSTPEWSSRPTCIFPSILLTSFILRPKWVHSFYFRDDWSRRGWQCANHLKQISSKDRSLFVWCRKKGLISIWCIRDPPKAVAMLWFSRATYLIWGSFLKGTCRSC